MLVKNNEIALEISQMVNEAKNNLAKEINKSIIYVYWNIGKIIVRHENEDNNRMEYGKEILKGLSKELTKMLGKGYSYTNLTYMRWFYNTYPDYNKISKDLSWSHYVELITMGKSCIVTIDDEIIVTNIRTGFDMTMTKRYPLQDCRHTGNKQLANAVKRWVFVACMLIGPLMHTSAQNSETDEAVVQSIKDDIQAVKGKVRETCSLLRDQERELRKLTTELERTRTTIQQNKQRARDAKKKGKEFEPKPVKRTYTSIYAHDELQTQKPVPTNHSVGSKDGSKTEATKDVPKEVSQPAERTVQKKPASNRRTKSEKQKPEPKSEATAQPDSVAKKTEAGKQPTKQATNPPEKTEQKTGEETKPEQEAKKKSTPANNRRISDKEALRLQKERNKYYENQLKEKKKAAQDAEKQAAKEAAQAEKEKKRAEKEAAQARKKMEKEKRKGEAPVASARRQRDVKEKETSEETESTEVEETSEKTE